MKNESSSLVPRAVLPTLLALAGAAQAQSGASVYGIVDVAMERLTNVNSAGDNRLRQPSLTGSLPSRLGFRVREDLGAGTALLAQLEMGFAPNTGNLNFGGRAWGRGSFVGFSTPYGTVTGGRLPVMTTQAIHSAMGPSLYSLGSIDSYIPNALSDNTVGYLGTFGPVSVGATYSLGRDTVAGVGPAATNCPGGTGGKACHQWTGMLKYSTKAFSAAMAHDVMNGGPNATLGLNDARYRDRRTLLSASMQWDAVKLFAGVLHRSRSTATELRSNIYYVGASYPFAPRWTADVEVYRYSLAGTANDSTLLSARVSHAFSARTAVYASAGHVRNASAAAVSVSAASTVGTGLNQLGLAAGVRHSF
ncbi:porin [Pseudorhodoferax sp. Leaf265]|uniref:porin n=1 Tax=Pseudorhodoferax sp. Leaf265 TaxID=1736315 RepID=UPI0007C7CE28|nr:porin [Pseudorhodoferax sp. Leaf265]